MNKRVRPQYKGAEAITALIYLCSMSASLMYVICRQEQLLCTVIMTALSFGIYLLFYLLRKKRIFAVTAFLALGILSFVLTDRALNKVSENRFVDFIFKNSESFDVLFAAAAIVLFSCIIGFTVCYFSVYLPRPSFLMLPALIPMILSARTAGGLPPAFIVFLAAGFGVAALGAGQPEFPNDIKYIDDKKSRKERLVSICIFGVISALVLTVVPRSTETPMGEYLDTVFNKKSTFFGRNELSNFTNNSGVNHGANKPSDNVLFYASTTYPVNVSRWSFDKYNGETGWTALSDYTTGWSGWRTYKKNLSTNTLAADLRQGALDGCLAEYAPLLKSLTSYNQNFSTARMNIRIADNTSTKVVIHPNMTTDVNITGYDNDIYRTYKDEMFTKGNMSVNASYSIDYYIPRVNESLIRLFERADMEEILTAAVDEGVISSSVKTSFISERTRALEYHEKTLADPINPEIVQLANEITAGLTSDYDKALAIEKWFGEAGFVYDLDFVPEETTAEYFLFKSKRGICSDYATATTLLLRAADIPTRYTEGFVLDGDNIDEYGRFAVKPANAHAYSTCYIEGFGWLEIDGTKYAALANENEELTTAALIILISLGALAILAIVFHRQISEGFFTFSLLFRSKNGKIRAIYLRTRKLVCSINGADPDSTAAGEVCQTAERTLGLYNEAREITESADLLLYGGKAPDIPAKQLLRDYRKIRKTKRKMKK
ncbi:MAG: hypothetical protein J6C38_07325 [Oscillospiraceae bacterium]|nr:hypothetical protein [Oscillospiraceae bacterium]